MDYERILIPDAASLIGASSVSDRNVDPYAWAFEESKATSAVVLGAAKVEGKVLPRGRVYKRAESPSGSRRVRVALETAAINSFAADFKARRYIGSSVVAPVSRK